MKHSLLKLTGLLLAVMLVLTGCNLIGVDELKQLNVDFAKLEKEYSAVVVDYNGGTLTKSDVLGGFMNTYAYYAQMYAQFGLQLDQGTIESLKQEAMETSVQNVAIAKQMESRGLKLSDEKIAETQAAADEEYGQAFDSFSAQYKSKDEALNARQAEYDLYANGFSKEAVTAMNFADANYDLVRDAVRDEIAELTDEELTAAYDEKVADDEASYSTNPGSLGSAMTNEDSIVAWIPEGYRTVKHILVKPEEDVQNAVNDARNALKTAETKVSDLEAELASLDNADATEADATEEPRSAEAVQADIDAAKAEVEAKKAEVAAAETACLDSVKAVTDEIYAKLEAGEDFASLIEAYGEDPGMQNEPTKTRGYYVCDESTNWDANFTKGAMSLTTVGEYTLTPAISTSGVHIIRFETEVKGGAVALDDIRDALYADALETAKDEHFETELEAWMTELAPVYHAEALNIG